MTDIWEQIAPQQRLSELLKLLKEQKERKKVTTNLICI